MRKPKFGLRQRLIAGSVDAAAGIIRGAVVAKPNTEAVGHFAYKHADGSIDTNPKNSIGKLQIKTDPQFIDELVASTRVAGGKLKVRIDHDDSIQSRVGYASNFRTEDGSIKCDLQVYKNSAHGPLVLETAVEDSANIGLSVEFEPSFEEKDGFAIFRAGKIFAVDIVDQGAITPDGLFLSAGVDSEEEVINAESPHSPISKNNVMPDPIKDPTPAELAAQFATLSASVAALAKRLDAMPAPTAAPDAKKEEPNQDEALAAKLEKIVDAKVSLALQKRESSLGLRGGDSLANADAGDGKKESKDEKPKAYLELVKEEQTTAKLSEAAAHRAVMKKHPAAYKAYRGF